MPALDCFMGHKRIIRTFGDIREHPRYSAQEAAEYIRVPVTTLKAWLRGQDYFDRRSGKRKVMTPVIEAADPVNKLLSWLNLAEAHVLRSTTERKVPLQAVRRALEYVRSIIPGKHPLLTEQFSTFGKSMFVEHLGQTVNATKMGQIAMRDMLEEYLERLEWDESHMPVQIYPIRTTRIVLNPLIASGKPVIKGTGIMVSVLRDRSKKETFDELADDYGINSFEIQTAIQELALA
jgi:uncharacterized protein (DUF433 family)